MKRFFLRALIWLALISAILTIFIILFYAEEDWRGSREWAECKRELQAKGETLDLQQLAPLGRPENDLTKTPIFAELLEKDQTKAQLYKFYYFGPYLEKPGKQDLLHDSSVYLAEGKPLSLESWQSYYRSAPASGLPQQVASPAQDVLTVLGRFDSELAGIDSALRNPEAFWPIDCVIVTAPFKMDRVQGFIGIYDAYSVAAEILQMQGIAHLENNESAKAEQNFLFIQRLAQSLLRAPGIVSKLMAIGVQQRGEGLLWEGIRRHAWNDSQLSEMGTSMASANLLQGYREALRFDRGSSIQCLSYLQEKQPIPVPYPVGKKYVWDEVMLFFDLAPQGRIDQTKTYFCREIQKRIDAVDLKRGVYEGAMFVDEKKPLMVPFLDLQGMNRAAHHVAQAETNVRMARLACSLERYYLKEGHYPENLNELLDLPPRINQEVLSERPFHYQRKGNGYLLYSVGWDGIDHGGMPTGSSVEDGETVVNADYDWVWPSP